MKQSLSRFHGAKMLMKGLLLASLMAVIGYVVYFGGADEDGDVSIANSVPAEFVGATKCAECHQDEARAHAASGHSHTLARISDTDFADTLDKKSWTDPERDYAFEYEKRGKKLFVRIPDRHQDLELPLEYAFGSGHHSTGFVTLISDSERKDTVALEHRGLFVTASGKLTVAPGHSHATTLRTIEDFGMIREPVDTRACFDCHTTFFHLWRGEAHGLIANVECEKCHGAGRSHVAAIEEGSGLESPEFRRQFDTAAEEIKLCGQCHRMPEFMDASEIVTTNRELVRFQPVGLMESECFQKSDGALRCTSCHNPHEPASATTTLQYNDSCRDCHDRQQYQECTNSPAGNCVQCHMPKVEVLPEMVLRDHWIRVLTEEPESANAKSSPHAPVLK